MPLINHIKQLLGKVHIYQSHLSPLPYYFNKGISLQRIDSKKTTHNIILLTKEVVKDSFTECAIDLHKVSQAIEILLTGNPLWLLQSLSMCAGVVQPEESALGYNRKQNIEILFFTSANLKYFSEMLQMQINKNIEQSLIITFSVSVL